MKVMTVLGTRPEIIRLSRVIALLDATAEHVLVHTGQNYDYELNQIFFDELEIRRPDHFLEAAGANAAETIGLVISRTDELLTHVQPDAVLGLDLRLGRPRAQARTRAGIRARRRGPHRQSA